MMIILTYLISHVESGSAHETQLLDQLEQVEERIRQLERLIASFDS